MTNSAQDTGQGAQRAQDSGEKAAEQKAAEQKAADERRRRWARINAFLFVLAAFILWFVFALLAQKVITCVPTGCSLIAWPNSESLGTSERVVVMSITLAIALWVSGRAVFPPED